jgi:hypothetical protein
MFCDPFRMSCPHSHHPLHPRPFNYCHYTHPRRREVTLTSSPSSFSIINQLCLHRSSYLEIPHVATKALLDTLNWPAASEVAYFSLPYTLMLLSFTFSSCFLGTQQSTGTAGESTNAYQTNLPYLCRVAHRSTHWMRITLLGRREDE